MDLVFPASRLRDGPAKGMSIGSRGIIIAVDAFPYPVSIQETS